MISLVQGIHLAMQPYHHTRLSKDLLSDLKLVQGGIVPAAMECQVINIFKLLRIKELIPVLIALFLWGHKWSRHKILVYCSNEAVVFTLNKQYNKDPYTYVSHCFLFKLIFSSI